MTSRDKKLGGGLLALAVVTAMVVAWNRRPANNENFPDGTFWMCIDPKCKAEFALTIKELSAHHQKHYGQPPTCPKCNGSDTIRANRCPSCNKIYPMLREMAGFCPHCKKVQIPQAT